MGAISRFKGERPVRVRVQLDFMFIRLVPDEGWGEEGRGWIVLLIERLNDLKGKKKKEKREIKRVEIKLPLLYSLSPRYFFFFFISCCIFDLRVCFFWEGKKRIEELNI